MFALRGQLLPSMGRHRMRSVPFRSPIAISVPQRSDDDGQQQHEPHEQQVRQYGRTCPAVRRHALRKKRAASGAASAKTEDTASTGAAGKDAMAAFTTSSNAHSAAAATTTAAAAASVLNLNNLKVSSNDGPTMEVAQSMPINYAHMDNISLLTLSAMNNEKARAEMLRRHIMVIDNVSYSEACLTFKKIDIEIRKGMFVHSIPYKLGIMAAGGAAVGSIPLCFHLPTVEWFNELYVTTDVPPPEDLETWLEVGTWAWNWMEPPLGQISFFLLCLSFARAQISNLGVQPYTAKLKTLRADKIVRKFPQYDEGVLTDYSKSINFY